MSLTNNQIQLAPLALTYPLPAEAAFKVDLSPAQFQKLVLQGLSQLYTQGVSAGVGGRTPVSANVACTQVVAIARNSATPARVGLTNHGPNPVTVNFGITNAVSASLGIVLGVDDYYETPTDVIGKITAICATGETASLGVLTF